MQVCIGPDAGRQGPADLLSESLQTGQRCTPGSSITRICFACPDAGGGAWQTPFESMEIGQRGSSRSIRACTLQIPLEGVLQQGGVAFVLRSGSGQWVRSQTWGNKQLDFYVSCREVGCPLRPRNDPQRLPANALGWTAVWASGGQAVLWCAELPACLAMARGAVSPPRQVHSVFLEVVSLISPVVGRQSDLCCASHAAALFDKIHAINKHPMTEVVGSMDL